MTDQRELQFVIDSRFSFMFFNRLSDNPTKWSNTRKQFVGCLSVFNHFVGLAVKELRAIR